jgi:hypothetical protein
MAILAWMPIAAMAQTSPDDPAVVAAKAKAAVVFDLGRMFGYLQTMEKEMPQLSLSPKQLASVYDVMQSIAATKRMEPDMAETLLVRIEDDILTPEQLMATDELAIAKSSEREAGATTNTPGSGGGQITSFIAGGAFNPMLDGTKTIGKDYDAFYRYVKGKLGK